MAGGVRFNFGIHLPIIIGPVYAIDICVDHPMALDEEYLITISNLEVRDAWWVPWADIGQPSGFGPDHSITLTARSTSHRINFDYNKQKIGFRQLNYLNGCSPEHRIPWSNFAF